MAAKHSVAPQTRVNITYRPLGADAQEEKELPLKLLVIGDFTLGMNECPLRERAPVNVDKKSYDDVLRRYGPSLDLPVTSQPLDGQPPSVELRFDSLNDFGPDAVIKRTPGLRGLLEIRNGLTNPGERIDGSGPSGIHPGEPGFTKSEIDDRLSRQIDEILHHARFQKLEAAWRSLGFLVDRTEFSENIKIEVLNVSMDELLEDCERAGDVTRSSLFRVVYTDSYGKRGGEPYGAIIGNYEFGSDSRSISLLQHCAAVGAYSHSPFISSASPGFFGLKNWESLQDVRGLASVLDEPRYAKWRSFRESEDSKYIGLTLPRVLLRNLHRSATPEAGQFQYEESIAGDHRNCLWGNASFAFASCLVDAFAKYRLCSNIIGPRGGGEVVDLPFHDTEALDGQWATIPTEIWISDLCDYELSELGFIPFVMREGTTDRACFFSANSCFKPPKFGWRGEEHRRAEIDASLVGRLPYLLITTRLAQYLKTLYRDGLKPGRLGREEIQNELNRWLWRWADWTDGGYRPLWFRIAEVRLDDFDGMWSHAFTLQLQPSFRLEGEFFDLRLHGVLN